MPIEFPCPTCHQQVRTPDAAAGKKGKCPNCGTLVMIPAPVVALPPPTSRPPDPARMPPPAKPQSPAPPASPAAPTPTSPAPAAAGSIEFDCPTCHKVVRTPLATAGKKGQCPHCQAVVQIPIKSSTPAAKPMPVAKPLPIAKPISAKPIPKPQPEIIDLEEMPEEGSEASAIPGLTPLGSGLTPLPTPGANPYGGGLIPLGPAPVDGLIPLGPAPPSPATADPLAGLIPIASYPAVTPPAANPLGLPPSALVGAANPYASPSVSPFGSGYGQPAYQTRKFSDSHRRGLPWERDPSLDSFTETMSVVLGSPQEAFTTMRRTGGLGNPIGFLIIGLVIGQIANSIYGIILSFIQSAASDAPLPFEALILVGAGQLVGGVVLAVVLGPIATLVIAGIYHLLLVMVGGGNAGYEATFRSVCFVNGSTSILLAIPCVGMLLYPFFIIIIMIHAFANAHETSGSNAAFSVLGTMFGAGVCCVGCGVVFVLPAVMQAVNQLP